MTTEAYLEAITTEYYDGSAWVDITAYVVGDIRGNNGLGGWKPENRVAVLGTLNITLNNKSKLFSPMGGDTVRGLDTLTGFTRGAKIRITGTFRGETEVIWTGRILSIDSDDLNWGNEQARLMAVDYMHVLTNYPMKGMALALNKTINEAMTLVLARLSLQPEATNFDAGKFIYPAVFDNILRKTMALSEFVKLANSELGYIYVRQDGTLYMEDLISRRGWRVLEQVSIPAWWIVSTDIEFLLMEDGGFLLQEDGDKILLDDGVLDPLVVEDASISTDAEGYNIFMSEDDLLNASIIRAHPVITDTSLKVLYKLGTPLFIPPGKTVTFSAHYTDPSGLSQISGTNMQAASATTDYLANSAEDGSGTDYTADVEVSETYYADIVHYSITNNEVIGIYMTLLQARGYGKYYGNSIESTKDDTDSQDLYGYAPFQFDMKYQKDTYLADMYGLSVIEEYKFPKSRVTSIKYLANLNKNHMMSFLYLSIGHLISGTEDRSGITNNYFITDRAFTIKQGGIINVEYGVKQHDSYYSGGLEPVTVEFVGGSTDAIDFGYLPQVSNLTSRSWSVWIYLDDDPGLAVREYIFGVVPVTYSYLGVGEYGTGYTISAYNERKIEFFQHHTGAGSANGVWRTPANSIPLAGWVHIAITHNITTSTTAPIIYINGTAQTLTTEVTPVGSVSNELSNPLVIGNNNSLISGYSSAFDGKIFDARVYNRILSAAEVTTLYNSGTPDHTLVTIGLMFQGMATYTDRPIAAGTVLTSTDKLVENILRAVGIPNGSPTIRANP